MHYLRPRRWPGGYGEQGERVVPVPARGLQILPGLLEPRWGGVALDRQVSHLAPQPLQSAAAQPSRRAWFPEWQAHGRPRLDSDDVNDASARDLSTVP